MTGYAGWVAAVLGGLLVNVIVVWGLVHWSNRLRRRRRTPAHGLVLALGLAVGFASISAWGGAFFWMVRDGADGISKWKGGDGPNTECWYAYEDDPHRTTHSGNQIIVIPGTGSTLYTYCAHQGSRRVP